MVLLIEQRQLWPAIGGVHANSYKRDVNVATEQWLPGRCKFVTSRCLAAKLEGGFVASATHLPRERQELLWREYFSDPTMWWDNRRDKKSSSSPDFRHKETNEVLWLDNFYKPGWVDAQLIILEKASVSGPATVLDCEGDVTPETVSKLCARGQLNEAFDALGVLVQTGSRVSISLLSSVLKQCVARKNLVLGRRIHDLTLQLGYKSNTFMCNHILRMYASQGRLQEAMDVFTSTAEPDAYMWSSIISACARHAEPKKAIQLYQHMRCSSVKPDGHVFVAALQACAIAADLKSGREVHTDVLESGVPPNLFVCNCLVDMYAKCGKLEDARRVFDSLATRDLVTWTAMISGYAQHGEPRQAIQLYQQMRDSGLKPDAHVIVAGLQACASAEDLEAGREMHSDILESGVPPNLFVCNCLVDMYGKCGQLDDARRIFNRLTTRDVVTWTAMIAGYAQHGLSEEALALYTRMEQEGMTVANSITFACLLNACTHAGALQQGKEVHLQILERGLLEGNLVVGSCLVNMYAKCGKLEDAHRVFDSMVTRNVVIWNSIIGGYAEHGPGQEALALYARMECEGLIVADSVTFACLLKACARIAALQQGRQLHSQILERGLLKGDILVGNCLVEMYSKCGKLEDARTAFDSLPRKDVVTWNIMINGYGQSNEAHKAIACFQEMLQAGVQPSSVTFTCLIVACSHEGLVDEGRQYFNGMQQQYGITPTIDHYTCMVDLLARAGYLDEAEHMLLSYTRNDVGFTSLLNACRSHGDVERGTRCFESLVRMDPQNAGAYVLMANTYSDAGRWADVDRIEVLRKSAGASKKPGMAGIEVNKQVHTFVVGEKKDDIGCKARSMNVRLRDEGGHVPHTELVLKPLSQTEKEDDLCGHAEKLALAYGLLNTPDGTPLLVTKNLRMCRDCHSSTTIMSRIENREIVVRDAHRVHRFIGGSCSCGGRP